MWPYTEAQLGPGDEALTRVLDRIQSTMDAHFPYIQQNYEKATQALNAARHSSNMTDDAKYELAISLEAREGHLETDLASGNEAFKRVWEAVWP